MVLLSAAALSFLIARMFRSRPLVSNFWWSGNVGGFEFDFGGGISWPTLIPIILLGVVGLYFWVWPSRKPPKLSK